tara:strand:- start:10900 stop:11247 length:348 start_codon:yes stop_codon:yes gene_type:complete
MNMVGRSTEFRVKAGSLITLQLTITNDAGTAKNLTNDVVYNTGKWKVWKPDGTLIINGDIVFTDRTNGIISYTLQSSDTVIGNAGNWAGEVELKRSNGNISEQTKTFNFVIEESY